MASGAYVIAEHLLDLNLQPGNLIYYGMKGTKKFSRYVYWYTVHKLTSLGYLSPLDVSKERNKFYVVVRKITKSVLKKFTHTEEKKVVKQELKKTPAINLKKFDVVISKLNEVLNEVTKDLSSILQSK